MAVFDHRRICSLKAEFERIAFKVFRKKRLSGSEGVRDRRICAWTGVSATVLAKTWDLLTRAGPLPEGATEECLLWGFVLLKAYDVDETSSSLVGCQDEGTYQRWAWYFVEEISYLESEVVSPFFFVPWLHPF